MSCQGSVRQSLLRTDDQRCLRRDPSARHACKQIIKEAPSGICPQDALADRSPKILFLGSVRQSFLRTDAQRCLLRDRSARTLRADDQRCLLKDPSSRRSCKQIFKEALSGICPQDGLANRSPKILSLGFVRQSFLRTDDQRYFL